jgi:hypothetical protein
VTTQPLGTGESTQTTVVVLVDGRKMFHVFGKLPGQTAAMPWLPITNPDGIGETDLQTAMPESGGRCTSHAFGKVPGQEDSKVSPTMTYPSGTFPEYLHRVAAEAGDAARNVADGIARSRAAASTTRFRSGVRFGVSRRPGSCAVEGMVILQVRYMKRIATAMACLLGSPSAPQRQEAL